MKAKEFFVGLGVTTEGGVGEQPQSQLQLPSVRHPQLQLQLLLLLQSQLQSQFSLLRKSPEEAPTAQNPPRSCPSLSASRAGISNPNEAKRFCDLIIYSQKEMV